MIKNTNLNLISVDLPCPDFIEQTIFETGMEKCIYTLFMHASELAKLEAFQMYFAIVKRSADTTTNNQWFLSAKVSARPPRRIIIDMSRCTGLRYAGKHNVPDIFRWSTPDPIL